MMFNNSKLAGKINRYLGIAKTEDLSTLQNSLDQAGKSKPQFTRLAQQLIPLLSSIDRTFMRLEESNHTLKKEIRAAKVLSVELAQAKQAAEAASKTKSDFLANMSHEIRTPMNGIIGMTDSVLETDLKPDQRDYLNTVKSSAEALLVIINDILDFSKIEAGKLDIECIEFSLHDLMGETLKPLAAKAHEKQLDLIYRIAPELSVRWRGDPGRVRQVLTNWVGNAIKFTSTGQVKVEVQATGAGAEAKVIEFSVTDTGIGVAKEKQEVIFHAFSQADASTTRQYGGTGLGLTICARLAKLMGGSIKVRSQPGQGSRFSFTTTLQAAEHGHDSMPGAVYLPHVRALVVEHNPTQSAWLVEQMMSWGIQTSAAQSGVEALKIFNGRQQSFDFVLIDADLPDMSGFDLLETLGQRAHITPKTTLMIGASKPGTNIERCNQLGVAGYVIKPMSNHELLNAILLVVGSPSNPVVVQAAETPLKIESTGLKILLAEDHVVNQKVAMHVLGTLGHSVTLVETGAEAVQQVQMEKFDLVLMDLQMPVMGGLEATRAIRQSEGGGDSHQLIVAMTANAMEGDREKCLEAGMDGYISKPIRKAQLTDEIERVLSRAQARHIWKSTSLSQPAELSELAGEQACIDPLAPVLDAPVAMKTWNHNAELFLKMAQTFLDRSPATVSSLMQAVVAQDADQIVVKARSLQGAATNLSAVTLQQLATRLIDAAEEGDMAKSYVWIAQLPAHIHDFELALRRWAMMYPLSY